ncbi:Linear gramicidin synthase subunit B [Pelagimonas phthalicica]|uniref:Linear gramicidin synthase subunit B n=1 Tax=Pelagimonas phthalicica TaxID=1037362 RepID=A0A238J6Y4_9RHOB|nr:MupA/Atu3671 family FMN-dependent luciferase-like monooxygenase [Pelagimonas phthalicica]TDS95014.1 natural product biosynthesis luciferase-like monooxygenase protein [Pelagimonas phthalicica]SMX26460.1 Linear gramicidin synthase subunit B [Pelagimonas phthalicica]
MTQFSCIVIGNESLLVQCAQAALDRGNTVAAVVTRNDGVADWARGAGLRVEAPGSDLAARLTGVATDYLLSIANLDIIPEDVLALPAKGAINFHDGPLPRHAGLNAPVWALMQGETQHGISWHMIEGGVDEGDVLVSRSFDISASDTALTLNTKAYEAAIASFPALLDQLEAGQLNRTKQDLSLRSYHALADRPSGYGLLDFSRPAEELARLVRALDHGPYWNPLAAPKFRAKDQIWLATSARIVDGQGAPGTVLKETADHLTVACGNGAIELQDITRICGTPVAPVVVALEGDVLPVAGDFAGVDAAIKQIASRDQYWRNRFANFTPLELGGVATDSGKIETRSVSLSNGLAQVAEWVQNLSAGTSVDIAYSNAAIRGQAETGLVAGWVPLRLESGSPDLAIKAGFATDLFARAPELDWPQMPHLGLSSLGHINGTAITVNAEVGQLTYDSGKISAAMVELLIARLELQQALPQAERDMVLNDWNTNSAEYDRALTMHRAFEAQVAKTPNATALVFENQSLTYADLNARANRAAHILQDMGVAPGQIVGLCCSRSVDLLVGGLAILKAGGAYLPMDPSYPADRLQHFVQDSDAKVIVTQAAMEANLPQNSAQILVLDAEPKLAAASPDNLADTSGPKDLAYLIYTSGSTGTPKGVMIEHRNVINFYAGMDQHIPLGGTWLAVTSLSFDISVLELFWTTARGFKTVLTSDEDRGLISKGPMPMSDAAMEFSIYYWGNDDGVGRDKYKMLLEGAKFADQNGFCAVWTPERHFHAFGGPYPNPSVTGAAVAAVTQNIGVRSGSVVAPLHHPARIAEEWSVIDNLTNGRAGLAIASGWQPDDFVLRPENAPPNNKKAMVENIDQIRRLWRGEPVAFPKADGSMHEVVTQPRPVTKELPIWVTIAGNPETWREAGRLGCNVLTHLLGQSIDEVADKIKIYHDELRNAGHDPKDFSVSLMLHTYIAETRDEARETARQPMRDYLNSAAGLIKQYAWAFPAFKRPEGVNNAFDLQLGDLEAEDLDAILDFAFERYFNDSGLFGTVEDALARTEQLKRIGVTEIACLVDYGIDRDVVLEGLKPLARVVQAAQKAPELAEDDFSIAAQIVRHDVTHLQCTPSMARMIAMNDEARFALGHVQNLFLGGEPLPGALVKEFAEITDAKITNMYGPTETTIWSSVEVAQPGDTVVNIGKPLVNQQLYVLDENGEPVGVGQDGELWIGGDGVTRGYWNRPELTAEKFVANPFHTGRMYSTGDLVRRRADGKIDFVGRVDHQIKLRGFRIELGEIESVLESVAGVTQAVVAAREDTPGDIRLVGYYTGERQDEAGLKTHMAASLPSFMVPGRFMQLEAFPLTPNKKVNRKALPKPQAAKVAPVVQKEVAPQPVSVPNATAGDLAAIEQGISLIWTNILGVQGFTARDSFFDLGGHSLLAVQAHRAIREEFGVKSLSITDIFRFPVLSDLVACVASKMEGTSAPATADSQPKTATNERAQSRSDAMARRREMRAKRRA